MFELCQCAGNRARIIGSAHDPAHILLEATIEMAAGVSSVLRDSGIGI